MKLERGSNAVMSEACVGHLVGGRSVEAVGVDISRDFPGRPSILMCCIGVLTYSLCFIEFLGLFNGFLELVVVPLFLLSRAERFSTRKWVGLEPDKVVRRVG